MSHEIRTPLNGVLGMNSLLLEDPADRRAAQLRARTIRTSGKALLALINEILDLSRVEAERLELVIAEFDPRRLVEDVARRPSPRAHDKGLTLALHFQRDLPAVLLGDEGRLRQVFFNLIGNAVKFTERGSVSVDIGAEPLDDDRVELVASVRDTGIGIAADALPGLFERFRQADSGIARRYGGSGLGLAISRGLVELMGGRIDVETEPGQGNTFRVSVSPRRGQSLNIASADTRLRRRCRDGRERAECPGGRGQRGQSARRAGDAGEHGPQLRDGLRRSGSRRQGHRRKVRPDP